jgi:DNA repair protein RecO
MQQKHFKDDVIILKKFSINENDILVNAFGRFSGKIQFKAKGAKKILSKFTGRLEPLSIIQAELYNSGKSLTLTNANLKLNSSLGTNLSNFNFSQKMCYLLNKLVPFEEANVNLFNLIENVAINILESNCCSKTEFFFLTKFIDLAGHLPSFIFCNQCHNKFNQNPYLEEGNLICQKCIIPEKQSSYLELDLNTIKLLNYINSSNRIDQIRPIKIPKQNHQEVDLVLNKLINLLHT